MEISQEKEITLRDVLAIYRRRRKLVLAVALAVVAAAGVYCTFATRRYAAVGTLQIQKENSDMGLSEMMSTMADPGSDLGMNMSIQTQANILESDTLALRTVQALDLEHNVDFQSKFRFVRKLFPRSVRPEPPEIPLERAPVRRQAVLDVFSKRLQVRPVPGTRLIEITYLNPDPNVAAAVVNTLMKQLSDYNFQTRYEATNEASSWLNNQLSDLRKQTETLQAHVADLQKQSGVYSFGTTDAQGKQEAYSSVLDRLQQTEQAMTVATQNRILKGAILNAAEAGDAEMLSGLAGNMPVNAGGMNTSLAVIQALRQQEATQQALLKQASEKFGSEYPKVAELRAAVETTQKSISDEVIRIRGRAKSDYTIAKQLEDATRRRLDQHKKEADMLNNKAIEYTIVSQEALGSRALYEGLLKRLKEAGVLAGLQSSNITVVDPGRAAAEPKQPNIPVYMGIAVIGGLLLGYCSAVVRDTLDNKIHSIADLEAALGQPVFGATPDFNLERLKAGDSAKSLKGVTARALREPQSSYTEALRSIRTSVLLARGDQPPKTILVTSSIQGEGKSTFSANLATVLALQDKRVLLVDTDMRRGALRSQLGLTVGPGLSSLLAGQINEPPIQPVPGAPNLFAIQSGIVPPNPSELLASDSMRRWLDAWREEYDFVVLDGTPVLPVTDAVILDAFSEMTVLIVRSRLTERAQVTRTYKTLSKDGKRYIGIVLNGVSPHDQSYYGYYGYYGYRSNAYQQEEQQHG